MTAQTVAQAPSPARPPAIPMLKRSPLVQRACACGGSAGLSGQCEECRSHGTVRRTPLGPGAASAVPSLVHRSLATAGSPLAPAAREFFEPRFSHDFSQVRVHHDGLAAESARSVHAAAFTVGPHIVFGAGRYAPDTADGRRLLAHELAHVTQQSSAGAVAVQSRLEVGATDDPAEGEADRVAQSVLSGGPAPYPVSGAGAGTVIRRQPEDEPQRIGQTRMAHIPAPDRGDEAKVHVIRHLEACPCRNVPDTREGIFYNPDLGNLAIAYRHCRGGRTVDVYGTLESNASAFLTGSAPPAGTATVGIDVNIVGRSVGGRFVVEAVGSNVASGEGVGGRARIVFQGNRWRVFVTGDFLHRLGATSGEDLDLRLGAQLGPVTAQVEVSDVLGPAPEVRGTGCVDLGTSVFGRRVNPCLIIQGGGESGDVRVLGGLDIPLGGPEVRREECFQCLCPPAGKRYECYLDIPPKEVPVEREVEVERFQEFRYYFRLDRTTVSEDAGLRAQSDANLSTLSSQVAGGGSVSFIFGYASPEATERHNEDLAQRRAERMRDLIRERVGPDVSLPDPSGSGELLGRRPAPTPSSRLGDVITEHGFRSAEDLSFLLLGEEIPHSELSAQFRSLFEALPEPADRLAVFGLTSSDPIAPQALAAVEAFMRSGGRGWRPWESVFRMLRVAIARVVRRETETVTETERTPGSLTRLGRTDCNDYGSQAESGGQFGPIDPQAARPSTSSADRSVDCTIEPRREDLDKGCDYTLPAASRRSPSAPSMAPRRVP